MENILRQMKRLERFISFKNAIAFSLAFTLDIHVDKEIFTTGNSCSEMANLCETVRLEYFQKTKLYTH